MIDSTFVHLSAHNSLSVFHTQHIRLLGARSLSTMHTALPPAAPQKETLPHPKSPPKTHQPTLVVGATSTPAMQVLPG